MLEHKFIGLEIFPMELVKIKLRFFKSNERINGKRYGPNRGFGYLSLFSDPLNLAKWSQSEIL